MATRKHAEDQPPILTSDIGRRLDAIIRRQGGKPKPTVDPHRMVLPAPSREACEDQMSIDDLIESP